MTVAVSLLTLWHSTAHAASAPARPAVSQDGSPAERRWMAWFGRLLYLVERHNTLLQQPRRSQVLNGRPKMGRPRGGGGGGGSAAAAAAGRSGASGGGGEGEEGSLASSGGTSDLAEDSDDEEAEPLLGPGGRRGSAAVAAARRRLQEEVAARRAALAAANLRSEPGLCFWLERQRRRWRRQDLPAELGLMLQLAGVQLDCYSPVEWQAAAHTAAGVLQGSQVTLDVAGAARRARQAQQARQADTAPVTAAAKQEAAAEAAGASQPGGQQQQLGVGTQRQQRGAPPAEQRQPAGSARMRVVRWVQTQQALFAEGKLSAAQLRYMAFLGAPVPPLHADLRLACRDSLALHGGALARCSPCACHHRPANRQRCPRCGCRARLARTLAQGAPCAGLWLQPDCHAPPIRCRHHVGALRRGDPHGGCHLAAVVPAAGGRAAPAAPPRRAVAMAGAPEGVARPGLAAAQPAESAGGGAGAPAGSAQCSRPAAGGPPGAGG